MALRYAILALLRVGPLSGYDLQKVFADSVGHVWHAPDSQIYPELRRMADDGLVVGEDQARGHRGHRRVYHVTEAGEAAYRDWLGQPIGYTRTRDPASLRAAYLETATRAEAATLFADHEQHFLGQLALWEAELDRIRTGTHPILRRRLEQLAPAARARAEAFKIFAYEGLVDRAHAEIRWARRGAALVAELSPTWDDELPGS